MLKFTNTFNPKLISLIVICAILLTNTAYGMDLSKESHLRKPLDFNSAKKAERYCLALSKAGDAKNNKSSSIKEADPAKLSFPLKNKRAAARAEELRKKRMEPYLSSSCFWWPFPFRIPFINYFIPWLEESLSVQVFMRQAFLDPVLESLSWFSSKKSSISSLEEFGMFPFMLPLRHWGEEARKVKLALGLIDKARKQKPKWFTRDHKIILDTPAYSLLDFGFGEGYSADFNKGVALFVPPHAGHASNIVDYADNQSMVQTYLKKGFRVYSIDWKSATSDNIRMIDDLVETVKKSIDATGEDVVLVGFCQGGWVAAITAALYPEKVRALVLEAAPINTSIGDNGITRAAKLLSMEVLYWFIHVIGEKNVQDGPTQVKGLLNTSLYKELRLFLDIAETDWGSRKAVKRAETLLTWLLYGVSLSLWVPQAFKEHFQENNIYNSKFKVQVEDKLRRVILSRIKCPVILVEGEKDDITPPGTVGKDAFSGIVKDVDGLWQYLVRDKFINDKEPTNGCVGKRGVILDKAVNLKDISEIKFSAPKPELKKIFHILTHSPGQCHALADVIGTLKRYVLKRVYKAGHVGCFNGTKSQIEHAKDLDWLLDRLEECSQLPKQQAAASQEAPSINSLSVLKQNSRISDKQL